MFLILNQTITNGSENIREKRFVIKTYDTVVIPKVGELITDNAYKEPYEYKVKEVTYKYHENTCIVQLEEFMVKGADEEKINYVTRMFTDNGWQANKLYL